MVRQGSLPCSRRSGQKQGHIGHAQVTDRSEKDIKGPIGFIEMKVERAKSLRRQLSAAQCANQRCCGARAAVSISCQPRCPRRYAQHACCFRRMIDKLADGITWLTFFIFYNTLKNAMGDATWRQVELKDEAHPPQNGIVNIANGIRHPDDRRGIGFQKTIDEYLTAFSLREPIAVGALCPADQILHLVEQENGAAAVPQHALRQQKRQDAVIPRWLLAVFICLSGPMQCAASGGGQRPCQFCLACPGGSMDEDVDAMCLLAHRSLQESDEEADILNVGKIHEFQVCDLTTAGQGFRQTIGGRFTIKNARQRPANFHRIIVT